MDIFLALIKKKKYGFTNINSINVITFHFFHSNIKKAKKKSNEIPQDYNGKEEKLNV